MYRQVVCKSLIFCEGCHYLFRIWLVYSSFLTTPEMLNISHHCMPFDEIQFDLADKMIFHINGPLLMRPQLKWTS